MQFVMVISEIPFVTPKILQQRDVINSKMAASEKFKTENDLYENSLQIFFKKQIKLFN